MSHLLSRDVWFPLVSVLAILVFGLANHLLQPRLSGLQLDLTERRLYTLSEGTRETLADLAEPIDLTFVYTREVGQGFPEIRAYAERVREVLRTYSALAGRSIRLQEVDPEPFSEAEDRALAAGLRGVEVGAGDPLYFGLIGRNAIDDERVIPFFSPDREATLEYDLTRLIARLDDPSPPVVGVLSGLEGLRGRGEEAGYLVRREMAKSYRIEAVEPDFVTLPQGLDALVLAHPPALDPYQAWLIDQYLLRGGRLLIFVDPAAKAATMGGAFNTQSRQARSDFGSLGRHWGLQLSRQAVADASLALPVEGRARNGRAGVVGQPLFLATTPETQNDRDPIVSQLARGVHLGAPGALEVDPVKGLAFAPLLETGESPSFVPADRAVGDMRPEEVVAAYEATEGPLTLAGRLSGRFPTAFPEGPPPVPRSGDRVRDELAAAAAETAPAHLEAASADGLVIAVADTDLLDDGFYVDPASGSAIADNAAFVINALDTLTGASGLQTLRSRAPGRRPMIRVDQLRQAAESRYFEEQQALEAELQARQDRIEELQTAMREAPAVAGDPMSGLSPEERRELEQLRASLLETRARLREIEREFRSDIDALEGRLKLINIWGGPLLVLVLGTAILIRRRRQRT